MPALRRKFKTEKLMLGLQAPGHSSLGSEVSTVGISSVGMNGAPLETKLLLCLLFLAAKRKRSVACSVITQLCFYPWNPWPRNSGDS